eukprot:CAMPEP_0197525954 /NCGR_PEP_ID=MMETSP1318-20131121/15360_1 /TAXON_ID=552666 /ORGANISM="Partenskyella glossopodia, Strain RCC365" /LENGTH=343 /DNA_ID=CAMNT_0043079821 /DNA_START=41 /DNA_END=1072 /DNA_ORIENTATION=+
MATTAVKRKPDGDVPLPDSKKQRVGAYGGYHPDAIPPLPHAMEMYDQALAQHRAMKAQAGGQMQYPHQQEAYPTTSYDPYSQQAQHQQQNYYYGDQTGGQAGQMAQMQAAQYYYQDPSYAAAAAGYAGYGQPSEPGAINTLHASGFPLGTTEDDVNRLFCMQPGYIAVSFVSKPGKLPCAWVQFQDVQCAAAAKMVVDGTPMYGKAIRVGYARSEMKSRLAAQGVTHNSYNAPQQAINTLYITGLGQGTREEEVYQIVGGYDGFMGMSFVQKPGRNPHAFVLFRDAQASTVCLNSINGQSLNSRPLRVMYAKSEMNSRVATSGPVLQQQQLQQPAMSGAHMQR